MVTDEVAASPRPAGLAHIEVYPYCDPQPSAGIQFAVPGVPGNYVS